MTLLAYLSSQPAVKVSLLQLLKTRQVFLKNSYRHFDVSSSVIDRS